MLLRKHIRQRRKSSIKQDDLELLDESISQMKEKRPHLNTRNVDVPILWQRKLNGYRIVDLQLGRFMQALRFILVHYRPKYSLLRIKDTLIGRVLSFRRFCCVV